MITEVKQTEKFNDIELAYVFNVQNGGVSEVRVTATKRNEGYYTQIERTYWRDNSFAPTSSANAISVEENNYILGVINNIWSSYPDIVNELEEVYNG